MVGTIDQSELTNQCAGGARELGGAREVRGKCAGGGGDKYRKVKCAGGEREVRERWWG